MSPKSPPNSDTSWMHLFLNRSLLDFLTPETRSIDHPWDEAFKILLNNENSTFNHPELSFPFFRRQRSTRARKKIQALREFWDTLYISVISRDGKPGSKPGIYHFCGVIRLPPDSSGNSGDAFNCFLLFPFFSFFFLSKGGPRSFYFFPVAGFSPVETNRTEWVTRPGSIKGEHGLVGWIYAGYPRGWVGKSVPWIVWQLCGFRAQRFSTVQRLNPVDSYYAGVKYEAILGIGIKRRRKERVTHGSFVWN